MTGCRIIGPDEPLAATYVLAMDYADWKALHDGYDAQRTVMYRKILLEDGKLLEFFKTIYFFVECLSIIGAAPARYPALDQGGRLGMKSIDGGGRWHPWPRWHRRRRQLQRDAVHRVLNLAVERADRTNVKGRAGVAGARFR